MHPLSGELIPGVDATESNLYSSCSLASASKSSVLGKPSDTMAYAMQHHATGARLQLLDQMPSGQVSASYISAFPSSLQSRLDGWSKRCTNQERCYWRMAAICLIFLCIFLIALFAYKQCKQKKIFILKNLFIHISLYNFYLQLFTLNHLALMNQASPV